MSEPASYEPLVVRLIPVVMHNNFSAICRQRGRTMAGQIKELISEFIARVDKAGNYKWGSGTPRFKPNPHPTHRKARHFYRKLVVPSMPIELKMRFREACSRVDLDMSVVCRRLIDKYVRKHRPSLKPPKV